MKATLRSLLPGVMKSLLPRQWIAMAHYRHVHTDTGEYELTRIAEYLDPTQPAIDVGSHDGIYSYHLLGLTKTVIAFEANPLAAAFISRAIPGVIVENTALSSRNGMATLHIPKGRNRRSLDGQATIDSRNPLSNAAGDTITVPTRTLDSYAYREVGFIKIDVEGHEEDVLAGATALIEKTHPVLLIEIEARHNPGSLARISALLTSFSYRGHFFMPGRPGSRRRLAPLSEYDAEKFQNGSLVEDLDRWPRRRVPYVNNFLFLPH